MVFPVPFYLVLIFFYELHGLLNNLLFGFKFLFCELTWIFAPKEARYGFLHQKGARYSTTQYGGDVFT